MIFRKFPKNIVITEENWLVPSTSGIWELSKFVVVQQNKLTQLIYDLEMSIDYQEDILLEVFLNRLIST